MAWTAKIVDILDNPDDATLLSVVLTVYKDTAQIAQIAASVTKGSTLQQAKDAIKTRLLAFRDAWIASQVTTSASAPNGAIGKTIDEAGNLT